MARKPPLTADDAPYLTDAELCEMRPARDVMTAEEFAAVSSVRGQSRAAEPKASITLRLSRSVIDACRATGKGWRTRIDETLVGTLDAVTNAPRSDALEDGVSLPSTDRTDKRRA